MALTSSGKNWVVSQFFPRDSISEVAIPNASPTIGKWTVLCLVKAIKFAGLRVNVRVVYRHMVPKVPAAPRSMTGCPQGVSTHTPRGSIIGLSLPDLRATRQADRHSNG